MSQGGRGYYKCFIPKCKNTTKTAPEKRFICVPKNKETRRQWWAAARRDFPMWEYDFYCCEDHFNLEEDVANYLYITMMGGKPRLKKGVVPHKFEDGYMMESVDENEDEVPHESSSTTEDPLALSPTQPAAWEEDATDVKHLYDGISTSYVESLPLDLMKQYLSKLMLKKYNINLPSPYNIEGWMSDVKMWPNLNSGHIHQYLLCGQNLSGQNNSLVSVAAEGYETFKLGNVLAVENKQIHGDVPVCFLKAKVRPLKTTVAETYDSWVCLEETHGTILVSHCTCLTRFSEVCSHIVALLFRIETAVSLGMNHDDLNKSSSKLAVWNRYHRPKICVAPVRDINFTHPNSSKRHKQLYKQLHPQPLSESDQKKALAELKKIFPIAPVFLEVSSDTDTSSMLGTSHHLDPIFCHNEQAASGSVFPSASLKANINKSKMMVTGKKIEDNMEMGRYPCGVCGSGVGANSIFCSVCDKWCHKRCSGLRSLKRVVDFQCPACMRSSREIPVRMEDSDIPVKIEADEVPLRRETMETPFQIQEAEISLKMEENGEEQLGMEYFDMSNNMEDADLFVKSETDVFVKMEEIEESPYILGDYVYFPND